MGSPGIHASLRKILVVDLVLLFLGVLLAIGLERLAGLPVPGVVGTGHPGFLSFAMASVGLITFFGVLDLESAATLPGEGQLRRAITIAVITVYIAIVSIAAFYVPWEEFGEASRTMLTSFTGTVAVIVVFFFGTSAYVEVRELRRSPGEASRDAAEGP